MLINSLGLRNFKCFEELDVNFAPITLLTGANSSGKSSLINAILGVLQTDDFPFYLSPNGKYVNMGSYDEIVYSHNNSKNIEIILEPYLEFSRSQYPSIFKSTWTGNKLNGATVPKDLSIEFEGDELVHEQWKVHILNYDSYYKFSLEAYAPDIRFKDIIRYSFDKIASLEGCINYLNVNNGDIGLSAIKNFAEIGDFFDLYSNQHFIFKNALTNVFSEKRFNYVGSFRQPPERTYYQKSKAPSKIRTDGLGYTDQIIEWEESKSEKSKELIEITRKLGLFTDIRYTNLKGGRFELSVKVHSEANPTSLADVGFGVSQFLPIVVADLQLPDNSCLAVSQPEIHLHPKIQAQFGNYLADQVNKGGKQYIIETHSEYLLNRIRLLLVTGELRPYQVRILYFENDGIKSTTHNIEFATDGSVKGAPQGFFDTYGIDVMNIAMEAIG